MELIEHLKHRLEQVTAERDAALARLSEYENRPMVLGRQWKPHKVGYTYVGDYE